MGLASAFILALALTVLGGHNFLNIRSGHNQTVAPQNQPAIQFELPDKEMSSNEPAWTLSNQIAANDMPIQNLVNVSEALASSAAGYRNSVNSGQFFIAGIIVENQSENGEQVKVFLNNNQPQVVEAGYAHPANSDLAIN